jgi:hypothetical protein
MISAVREAAQEHFASRRARARHTLAARAPHSERSGAGMSRHVASLRALCSSEVVQSDAGKRRAKAMDRGAYARTSSGVVSLEPRAARLARRPRVAGAGAFEKTEAGAADAAEPRLLRRGLKLPAKARSGTSMARRAAGSPTKRHYSHDPGAARCPACQDFALAAESCLRLSSTLPRVLTPIRRLG